MAAPQSSTDRVTAHAVDEVRTVDPGDELDRQIGRLVELGYPEAAGLDARTFTSRLRPLRDVVQSPARQAPSPSSAPFVVVVRKRLVAAEPAMARTALSGKPGFVSADTTDVDRFEPIESVRLPDGDAYVAFDLERGDEYLNWSPDEAASALAARHRTPLTVEEGIAWFTQFPDVLEKNRCFMLAGSRCGDRRVPALWISSGSGKDGPARRGAPKLGWCWAGNRHTWLGHASSGGRVGAGS